MNNLGLLLYLLYSILLISIISAKTIKDVTDNQPLQESSSIKCGGVLAKLINLNPQINIWHLLTLQDGGKTFYYHLENPSPGKQKIILDTGQPEGVLILSNNNKTFCRLWDSAGPDRSFMSNYKQRQPFYPLCGGVLYLRCPMDGHKTTLEWATDFLRNNIPGGEKITVKIRENFYQDAFRLSSEILPAGLTGTSDARPRPHGGPLPARIKNSYKDVYLIVNDLGIDIAAEAVGSKVLVGRWYPLCAKPGMFFSAILPNLVEQTGMGAETSGLITLDDIEGSALDYLIAIDLGLYNAHFVMGTEHPRVDWSDRIRESVRDNKIPGPDGIGTLEPLVMTGIIPVYQANWAEACFTGGFKRYHGAFRHGVLAQRNHGSHYGFMENGVLLSRLQPGLATVIIYDNGDMEMRTWKSEYDSNLGYIRHARQNGVPLVEYDSSSRISHIGEHVKNPGTGNWSGSVDGRYRTLRAGIAIQEDSGRRFLLYGYFSSATPSAMALVFKAYLCRYAMMTDINALEHTYLAIYHRENGGVKVQHLVKGMNVLDKRTKKGEEIPRFLGFADNRDFFYLTQKE
ncbi:MAG: hypothetical protein ABIA63_14510 [bacterium]